MVYFILVLILVLTRVLRSNDFFLLHVMLFVMVGAFAFFNYIKYVSFKISCTLWDHLYFINRMYLFIADRSNSSCWFNQRTIAALDIF